MKMNSFSKTKKIIFQKTIKYIETNKKTTARVTNEKRVVEIDN